MPKVKTKSAAKKRFRKTATGKFKRASGYRRHLLTKKSANTKRHLRSTAYISKADSSVVAKLLPYL